ncbi:MAG: PorT family protein [Proteobacteria bacterium]|nr:MAG: PorT family protein [Pseudomonadota bacterium]
MNFKKIFSVATAAFLFTSAAHAEDRFGVLAGIDINKLNGDVASTGSTTGFVGGLFAQRQYDGGLFGEVQLRYIEKGGSYTNGAIQTSASASYIEIPVYAKYKFGTESGFIPYVFGGPSFAVNINSSAEALDTATNQRTSFSDGGFNTFDLGLDFGVGAEYAVKDGINVSLSAAYNLGLLDVIAGAPNYTNRGFQFYAGVSMPY